MQPVAIVDLGSANEGGAPVDTPTSIEKWNLWDDSQVWLYGGSPLTAAFGSGKGEIGAAHGERTQQAEPGGVRQKAEERGGPLQTSLNIHMSISTHQ